MLRAPPQTAACLSCTSSHHGYAYRLYSGLTAGLSPPNLRLIWWLRALLAAGPRSEPGLPALPDPGAVCGSGEIETTPEGVYGETSLDLGQFGVRGLSVYGSDALASSLEDLLQLGDLSLVLQCGHGGAVLCCRCVLPAGCLMHTCS